MIRLKSLLLEQEPHKPNVFCMHCKEPIGWKPNIPAGKVSHGICKKCLKIHYPDFNVGEGADPGWSNPGGGDRDAVLDKQDNTAWYETLNHAKAVIQELHGHLDALQKVEDSAAQQTTNLRIGEIVGAITDCRNKLAELVQ